VPHRRTFATGLLVSRRRRRPGVGICFRAGAAVPASAPACGRRAKPGSQGHLLSRRRRRPGVGTGLRSPGKARLPGASAFAPAPPSRRRHRLAVAGDAARAIPRGSDIASHRFPIKAPRDSEGAAGHWAHPLKHPRAGLIFLTPFGTRLIFPRRLATHRRCDSLPPVWSSGPSCPRSGASHAYVLPLLGHHLRQNRLMASAPIAPCNPAIWGGGGG
jgi:hypothetical protein